LDYNIRMTDLANFLRRHALFSSLDDATRDLLAGMAQFRTLQKGETLALQGEMWPYLFLVAEGELDATKISSEGRSLLVTTFRAGEVFWGPAFFQDGGPLLATLEAHEAARVFLWSREKIEPLFHQNGRMGWELCRLMIQRMQRASAIVEELAFLPVSGRLARLLLEHFDIAGEPVLERSLTLDEMASRVGTTREMVCRALYRFADRDLIHVTRTEFVLTNREGLSRLVEGS